MIIFLENRSVLETGTIANAAGHACEPLGIVILGIFAPNYIFNFFFSPSTLFPTSFFLVYPFLFFVLFYFLLPSFF